MVSPTTPPVSPVSPAPRYLFLQEEYGFRHWIGSLPEDMTVESVIEWWESLPTVLGMFFNPSQSFPMPLYEINDVADDDADVAVMQWEDSEGQVHILDREDVVLFCHTHEDDNSYLKTTKYSGYETEYFYHAGYGEMLDDDDDDEDDDVSLDPPSPEEVEEWRLNNPTLYKLWEMTYGRHSNGS